MAYRDQQPGDVFQIDFRNPGMLPGMWHGCGEHPNHTLARASYLTLIDADRAEAEGSGTSLIGCRWRLQRVRGAEVMETIADKHMTKNGLADYDAAEN